jgi:formyltetrahydrofolate-dependent phosphoribosylglycinamide formyltransferase
MSLPRLVVMISGSGSNLQALIDAADTGTLKAEIVLVVSNRRDAYGLTRAQEAEIPTFYFPLKPYKEDGRGREVYDADLAALVADAKPDLIVLAGWMHVFNPVFLDRFPKKVINLHPALPGTFVGTHGIERAFEAWQKGEIKESGCMVHYVIPEVDAGAVIDTHVVPFQAGDTVERYAERMHAAEHELLVEATVKVLDG